MATLSSVQVVLPEVGSNFAVDCSVLEVLPPNSKILKSFTYRTAVWTRAARVIVELEDGSEKSFFLKYALEDHGKLMIEGEFASISEIAKYNPALTPIPHAYSEFRDSDVPTYFFLMEYLDINTGAPEPASISKQLAELHANSSSPTGKFGFPITTCHGPHPQNLSWEDSWSIFFARLLRQFFNREINVNGRTHDGAYEIEFDKLIEIALPRLLEPLQSEGRSLKPSLVHGDLWEENCGTDLHTGEPKIFDAAVFYGHNEYELGMWRRPAINFGKAHLEQYFAHMPPSQPQEQWNDRHRLYSIKFELAHSIGWPKSHQSQRQIIFDDMSYLNEKYASDSK